MPTSRGYGFSIVWGAAALSLLASCRLAQIPAALAPDAGGHTASVTLALARGTAEAKIPGGRGLLALRRSDKYRLTITGADLSQPIVATASGANASGNIEITELPVGDNRVLKLEALDTGGTAIGSWMAVATLGVGHQVIELSAASTALGQVWSRWLATDKTTLAKDTSTAAVLAELTEMVGAAGARHFGLLKAQDWADAVAAAGGSLDVSGDFFAAAGSANVAVFHAPPGAPAALWLDDPVSPYQGQISPRISLSGGRYQVDPIAPGTWTLHLALDGFPEATASVAIAEGATTDVEVALARWDAGATLPAPRGDFAHTSDGRFIYLIGGVTAAAEATDSVLVLDALSGSPAWTALPNLPAARRSGVAALVGSTLYYAGGKTSTGTIVPDVFAFDTNQPSGSWTTLTLPGQVEDLLAGSRAAEGEATAAFAEDSLLVIHLSSFYDFDATSFPFDRGRILVYDTVGSSWAVDPSGREPIRTVRLRAGVAAMDVSGQKRVAIVGGDKPFPTQDLGSLGNHILSAVSAAELLDVGSATWQTLPDLPTGRAELGLAYADNAIYAAGGVDRSERLFGLVERYDFALGRWLPSPMLREARSSFALEAAGGKLWAIGGSLSNRLNAGRPGISFDDDVNADRAGAVVLDTVETLVP